MNKFDFDGYLNRKIDEYTDNQDYSEKLEELEKILVECDELYFDNKTKENKIAYDEALKELNDFKIKDDDEENYYQVN